MCFVGCAAISLAPAITRLYQDAGYFAVDGKAVPYLLHEEDQKVRWGYLTSKGKQTVFRFFYVIIPFTFFEIKERNFI